MHHIGAIILGLFFGGGTILAIGSVLTAVKRSASLPQSMYTIGPIIDQDELLPGVQVEESPNHALLAMPSPPICTEEIAVLPQSQPAETSRKGKGGKKSRNRRNRNRAQEKIRGKSSHASRKIRESQTN